MQPEGRADDGGGGVTEPQAGLLLLLVVPVLWGLRWLGWRGRQRRQGDVPELAATPSDPGEALFGPVEATYVSSTSAGDWLDRVAVRGLGVRSAAWVAVHRGGVVIARQGAPDLWLAREALVGVRRARGMAGKFVDSGGLVVLTWRLGSHELDTGLRVRAAGARDGLETAVRGLLVATGNGDGHEAEARRG